ncbi:MAG: hypothetical protein P8074_02645 [Anaerolineales bacterium]|jgi:hypothetical protein
MFRNLDITRWKPGVPKDWLYGIAGLMWSGVGVMLCSFAYRWLAGRDTTQASIFALTGLGFAFVIFRFGFSKFASKNIHRLNDLKPRKVCIFAFQEWKSYPLVAVMIGMGIALRLYLPIPKPYLAVLYEGIGGGLFLSSFLYYRNFVQYSFIEDA